MLGFEKLLLNERKILMVNLKDLEIEFKNKNYEIPDTDKEIILGAVGKLSREEKIAIREYDKLAHFLAKKDAAFLAMLKTCGNDVVTDHLILAEGQMPNAAALVVFTDVNTNEPYTVLIRNGKFNQYASPGGKLDKADQSEDLNQAYINGAIRELRGEALNIPDEVLQTIPPESFRVIGAQERSALGIPEHDKLYDTRTVCIDLGRQNLNTVKSWLTSPQTPDSVESFCIKVSELDYAALRTEAGKFGPKYLLTREDSDKKEIPREVRATTLVILNGPLDKPELGFRQHIGGKQKKESEFSYSDAYRGTSPLPTVFPGGKAVASSSIEAPTAKLRKGM